MSPAEQTAILMQRFHPLKDYEPVEIPIDDRCPSAVLIPVVARPHDQLIYTLRSSRLRNHAGQISFPGGRIEAGETPWQAALREADEEIGLPPEKVKFIGRIDDVFSPHGFHIACFVGLCSEFEPRVNPDEVEQLVKVDLGELFDETLHETKPWKNRDVHYFHFNRGRVWGVTGHITYRLREILKTYHPNGFTYKTCRLRGCN